MNAILAHVYIPGGQSIARRTFPGHTLPFVGGHAEVRHEYDMPHVLAMPDARVQVIKEWSEWLPKWEAQIPGFENKVKAQVEILGGTDEAKPAEQEAVDDLYLKLPEVVFGKHPVGHQCGYCDSKRRKAFEALAKDDSPE